MLNHNLTWRSHINKISSKISRTTGVLNRLKYVLPENVRKLLYCSLILPHMQYGILAWGFEHKLVDKLQKKAIRTIACAKYNAHTDPLFRKYGILKCGDLFKRSALIFYYKYKQNTLPLFFLDFIQQNADIHGYETRQSESIHHVKTKNSTTNKCIRNYLPTLISNTQKSILDKIHTHSLKRVLKLY